MQRIKQIERPDRGAKLESIGLSFHSWDDYWNEGVAYKFSLEQVNVLEAATYELHGMCLNAVDHILATNQLHKLGIPDDHWEAIKQSWNRRDMHLYGRFDLVYDGVNPPKMLEYNADTPTSLLESAVAQWYWLQDVHPNADQFNSIHEDLVDRWKMLPRLSNLIHFASLADNEEDWVCVHYLMETATQAGFDVEHLTIENIGYDSSTGRFVDMEEHRIHTLFKLYPWEWMLREEFGVLVASSRTAFIEPLWKSILSNKALLPILWEMYPDNQYLLPAYFEPDRLTSYAKKPIFSREGANIELWKDGKLISSDEGPYGAEGFVYQQLVDMPNFDGFYPVIGSWVIGGKSSGICIREDSSKITTNMSHFIPHYFE